MTHDPLVPKVEKGRSESFQQDLYIIIMVINNSF